MTLSNHFRILVYLFEANHGFRPFLVLFPPFPVQFSPSPRFISALTLTKSARGGYHCTTELAQVSPPPKTIKRT